MVSRNALQPAGKGLRSLALLPSAILQKRVAGIGCTEGFWRLTDRKLHESSIEAHCLSRMCFATRVQRVRYGDKEVTLPRGYKFIPDLCSASPLQAGQGV